MRWLKAPNLTITHGFSTRHGGVSPAPFDTLNLGGHDDDPSNIEENRRLALQDLGISRVSVSKLRQVHGNQVVKASAESQTGDALVTKEKGIALCISVADCYPVLFHDPHSQVIGAAHAGWRGILAEIPVSTIREMHQLGAGIQNIKVAIGQGISRDNFEVGSEVIRQFREAGFPESCFSGRQLDLLQANRYLLRKCGILPENIWAMERCSTEPDFFSYRRDKGLTGRMWAVIML
jgi:polyphenol oxidase